MKYLLFLPIIFFTACSSNDDSSSSTPSPVYPKSNGTTKIKDTVQIRSKKDYKNFTVDGSALDGTGNQDEDQEAPFNIEKGQLHNTLAKSWPESIHVRKGPAVIRNVYIKDVGEDAVTVFAGADNVIIEDCVFENAADKIIQLNGGKNIVIRRCYFRGAKSAIRIKSPVGKVTIEDCIFVKLSGAIVLDKGVSKPTMSGNKFYNVQYELRQDQ